MLISIIFANQFRFPHNHQLQTYNWKKKTLILLSITLQTISESISQWRNMDRRLKLENLNCLILEFFFSKIYFLDQIYWQALVRPFKWHIGKVCIISRKKVTESGKNVKKGLKFVLFHFFDNENGENIFFGPSQLKVPKRWVLMVLKVFQCLLKQKSYKPNKIFLDLLSTNWAFEPLWYAHPCNLQ